MLNVLMWIIIVLTIVVCGYQVAIVGIETGNMLLLSMGAGLITFGLLMPAIVLLKRED